MEKSKLRQLTDARGEYIEVLNSVLDVLIENRLIRTHANVRTQSKLDKLAEDGRHWRNEIKRLLPQAFEDNHVTYNMKAVNNKAVEVLKRLFQKFAFGDKKISEQDFGDISEAIQLLQYQIIAKDMIGNKDFYKHLKTQANYSNEAYKKNYSDMTLKGWAEATNWVLREYESMVFNMPVTEPVKTEPLTLELSKEILIHFDDAKYLRTKLFEMLGITQTLLSPLEERRYTRCPECGSDNITHNFVTSTYTCKDCRKKWHGIS